jgi:glycosyltransferase involved in cell wall biosynthesis
MKIAIDARWIFDEISGIGAYTVNLIRSLARLDRDNTYLLIFNDKTRRDMVEAEAGLGKNRRFETKVVPYGIFSIMNQLFLPSFLKKNNVDIFHSTNYMVPLFMKGPRVVLTIHDIIPLKHPEYTPKAKKTRMFALYRWIMSRVVKISKSILADSENTREDIIEYFNCPSDKVYTVYPGIDREFLGEAPSGSDKDFKKMYSIKGKLVIYVGRQDPYKNVLGLVKAFRRLIAEEKVDAALLIAGPEDVRYPDARRFIRQYDLSGKIIFTGYLAKADLIALYRQADLLVLPSRYEGFGLPVVEAFAAGTPVVAADTSSLPEVIDDAGVLVSPDDIIGTRDAICRVLTDDEFAKSLVDKGHKRLGKFTWEKAAAEVLDVYRETWEK